MTELFSFFGTVVWSEPFPNDRKISILHKSLPYLCIRVEKGGNGGRLRKRPLGI